MKSFVIDANILFSACISGKDIYKNAFSSNKFYVPDFSILEIEKYKETILSKTKLDKEKLKEFTILLFSKLIVVPNFLISEESIKKAHNLCKEVDEKDTMYLALSIELKIPFITRDKNLHGHLIKKGHKSIIMFDEFLKDFIETQ